MWMNVFHNSLPENALPFTLSLQNETFFLAFEFADFLVFPPKFTSAKVKFFSPSIFSFAL